jgi:hypothetical protein
VAGAIEAFLLGVMVLTGLVAGIYWWMWVGGERERLPAWGVWVYFACLVIGNAAFAVFIATHYGT